MKSFHLKRRGAHFEEGDKGKVVDSFNAAN